MDDERALSIRKHYRKEGNQSNYITRTGFVGTSGLHNFA